MKVTFEQSPYERRYGYSDYRGRYRRYRRASERPDGHSIVYVSVSGETIFEQLINRRHRPYKALRPIVLEELTKRGIEFTNIRWSQKAGCSCPCSPGFIIQGGDIGKNYWLTIEDDDE